MTGKEFKEIREQLGLSQEQLSTILCLSGFKAVSNIETGFRNPSRLMAALMQVFIALPEKRSLELRDMLVGISKQYQKKAKGGKR